jgi:hypothetical protein
MNAIIRKIDQPARLGPNVRLAIEVIRQLPTAAERVAALASGYPDKYFGFDLSGQAGVVWLQALQGRAMAHQYPKTSTPQARPAYVMRAARWTDGQRARLRANHNAVPPNSELARLLADDGPVRLRCHTHTGVSGTLSDADGQPARGEQYSSRCTWHKQIYYYAAAIVGVRVVRGSVRYQVVARDTKGRDTGRYEWLEKSQRFATDHEGKIARVVK